MNLMILSAGRRRELISYFVKALKKRKSKVIAVDIQEYAPGLYSADKFYILKKDFENPASYIKEVIKICKLEKVSHIMTFIDPELELLCEYRNIFEKNDIKPIVSDSLVIKNTLDKYLFYSTYDGRLNVLKTYNNYRQALGALQAKEIRLPLIAKIRNGSASIGIQKIDNESQLKAYGHIKGDYIFQEFIAGKEIGVDVYIDLLSSKIVSVFMKEKIAMRAGETDKSISIYRPDILKEILKLEDCPGYRGPLDIDLFITQDNKIILTEINPRFGGGYPHGYFCGVNFMELMANNMRGVPNRANIGGYPLDVKMMKYNGLLFKKNGEIYEG